MEGTRTSDGLEFYLRPRGFARYPSAAFLAFWLCGWAVGEAIVGSVLVKGAIALLTGAPPGPGREPLALGSALAMGAFLLSWLGFWTLGGYAAAQHLLQLVWSSDRIVAGGGALRVLRRLGPFRSAEEIPCETLRRVYVTEGDHALAAEVDSGPLVLSSLGTRAERDAAARALRDELRVPEDGEGAAPVLPKGWEEILTPEGEHALVTDPAARLRSARVAWMAAVALVMIAGALVRQAIHDPKALSFAILCCAVAIGSAFGADRLRRGRDEWRIGTGSITLRRRYGQRVRDVLEGVRLELVRRTDGDGDVSFTLEAIAAGAQETSRPTWRHPGRKVIARVLREPAVPRRLGRWLSDRAKLPFEDKATPESANLQIKLTLSQLRERGPLGRRLADWIERIGGAQGQRRSE